MDGQRPSSNGRRNRKRSRQENQPSKGQRRQEPILIAARRPNAPAVRPKPRFIAASAAPRAAGRFEDRTEAVLELVGRSEPREAQAVERAGGPEGEIATDLASDAEATDNAQGRTLSSLPKRAARIVQVNSAGPDLREVERQRLIARLLASQGRAAITRAANDFTLAGFEFPNAQDVQLQLLEHVDESRALHALTQLAGLLEQEDPIKRPLFEQRLKRLEESADDKSTRLLAASLRKQVRG